MGHQRRAGYVREVHQYGVAMLQIDIPDRTGVSSTEFYGGGAIYRMTPCDQGTAEVLALDTQPVLVHVWTLERSLTELAAAKEERSLAVAAEDARQARWKREQEAVEADADVEYSSDHTLW